MKRMGKSIRDAEYVDDINMLRWRTALSTESKNRVFAAGSARYTVLYLIGKSSICGAKEWPKAIL